MLKLFILKDNKNLPWVLIGEIYVEVVDSSVYVKITEQASPKIYVKVQSRGGHWGFSYIQIG